MPPTVLIATGLFGALLALWSIVAPIARSPDEQAHVDLVMLVASGGSYPDFDQRATARGVATAAFAHVPGLETAEGPNWLTPQDAPPRGQRKTLAEWGGLDVDPAFRNQMSQHPPAYYWLTGTALRVQRKLVPGAGSASLDREWHLLRLGNALLLLPVPLLAWASARRLGFGGRAAEVASLVPLAIPQLTHIGGSVNNDNLLALLSACLAFSLTRVVRGEVRARTLLWCGFVAGAAMATKAFGVVLFPWIVIACAVATKDLFRHTGRFARHVAIALAPALVVGGAWPLRNLLRHGEPFPSAATAFYKVPVPGFEVNLFEYLWDYGSHLAGSFWGNFGWLEVSLPWILLYAASTVTAVACVVALAWRPRSPSMGDAAALGAPSRRRVAAFFSLVPLLVSFLMVNDLESYRFGGRHPFMQGRYAFMAVVPLVCVAGLGVRRLLGRWAALGTLAFALTMQAAALQVTLRAWWAEPDASLHRSMRALIAWSPWPELITVGILAGAAGLAAWCCTAVVNDIRAGQPSGRRRRA